MARSIPWRTAVLAAALLVAPLAVVGTASASPTPPPSSPSGRTPGAPATQSPDPHFGVAERGAALVKAERDRGKVAKRLRLGSRERLVVKDVIRDRGGPEHVRYERTYAGMPVIGGDLVVHQSADGTPTGVDSAYRPALRIAHLTPTVPASQAPGSSPRLVVYAAQHLPVLAWQSHLTGVAQDGTPVSNLVYTDARTGRRLGVQPQIFTDNGTGKTIYSGRVPLKVTKVARKRWALSDSTRGGLKVYDLHNTRSTGRGSLVIARHRWFGNYKTSSRQSVAADAQYGAVTTYNFYKATFGRNGIANNGRATYSRVHYGKNYDNAFWDDGCFCMSYGDGDSLKPLVELDIAGHEMTHGVTAQTSGLDYTGDAGGLNESTSDVMGTMVEFYARNPKDPGDYYLGEKVVRSGPGLRRMDNPSLDHRSVNCWSPSVADLDPHYSSGVGNHLFYLLAEGSGRKVIGGRVHNSPTCDGSTLAGIGRTAAAKIWYRAMTVYWVSSETYPMAADDMVKAARDLYGVNSTACNATVAAWTAVSVTPSESCAVAAPGPGGGTNYVADPSFENAGSGTSAWTETSTDAFPVISDLAGSGARPHSGKWAAWFNDANDENTDTLSQEITIPPAGGVTLKYFAYIATGIDPDSKQKIDTLTIEVNDGTGWQTVQQLSNLDLTYGTWLLKAANLTPYAGKTVTLRFTGHERDTRGTQFLIDDVAVRTN